VAEVEALAQNNNNVVLAETRKADSTNTEAKPVMGYTHLLKSLERTISAGDTIGKKKSIPLYSIRFRISKEGNVDTAYVAIPHAACSVHKVIVQELLKTKWLPAKEGGQPVAFEGNFDQRIKLTNSVQKKLRCRWR
jgi:hypothetical protein